MPKLNSKEQEIYDECKHFKCDDVFYEKLEKFYKDLYIDFVEKELRSLGKEPFVIENIFEECVKESN